MWPILKSFGASIAKARVGNELTGILITTLPSFTADIDALAASGFKPSPQGFYLESRKTFTLNEIKAWFPGFNQTKMIDRHLNSQVIELVTAKPASESTLLDAGLESKSNQVDIDIAPPERHDEVASGESPIALNGEALQPDHSGEADAVATTSEVAEVKVAPVQIADPVPSVREADLAREYKYALFKRPFDFGMSPREGFVRVEETPFSDEDHYETARYGVIVFNRRLTDAETKNFELPLMADGDLRDEIADRVAAGMARYAGNYCILAEDEPTTFESSVLSKIKQSEGYPPSVGSITAFSAMIQSRLRSVATQHVPPVSDKEVPLETVPPEVTAPVKKTRLPRAPKEPKVPKVKIVDAGEKIGSAKKDRYNNRRISVDDLRSMSDEDKSTAIKKAMWEYSYKDAKERGVSCGVAVWIKELRSSFPEMGVLSKVTPEIFLKGLNAIRDHIATISTPLELANAVVALNSNPDWIEYLAVNRDSTFSGLSDRWLKKNRMLIRMTDYSLKQIERAVDAGHSPAYFLTKYDELLDSDEPEWPARISYFWSHKLGVKTTEKLTVMKKKRAEGPKTPERPHLDNLRNEWPAAENVTAEQLMSRFGFRAIEFGEWLPQDERQRVLNEAYSACHALSETLGIPEKMISFNGQLAAAFGSRGSGRAMAHYEPDLQVFNLTRINGAGSMAHEWAHGLDDYLGRRFANNDYLSESKTAMIGNLAKLRDAFEKKKDADAWVQSTSANLSRSIAWACSWLRMNEEKTIQARAAVRDFVFQSCGLSVKSSDLPVADSLECAKFDLDKAELIESDPYLDHYDTMRKELNRQFTTSLKLNPGKAARDPSHQFYLNLRTAVSNAKNLRAYIVAKKEGMQDGVVDASDSDFLRNAKLLDGKKKKPYWSTTREMFARAFESYVYDKLEARGEPCDYLVHSVGEAVYGEGYAGNPYPAGDERKFINEKIDVFVSKLGYLDSQEAMLHKSILTGDINAFNQIIESGVDVNAMLNGACDINGVTPIQLVCNEYKCDFNEEDSLAAVKKLMAHGAVPDSKSIIEAIRSRNICNHFVAEGVFDRIDPAVINDEHGGYTLLTAAASYCRHDALKALIAAGADVNVSPSVSRSALTVVMAIASRRNFEIVKTLIDAGATIPLVAKDLVSRGIVTGDIAEIIQEKMDEEEGLLSKRQKMKGGF